MKKFKSILFLGFLLGVFLSWQGAQAIEYEMLGGRPAHPDPSIKNSESWFIYNLAPGESKEDEIEVMNLFNQNWEALIYAADTTRSSSGGFALKQASEPKTEVGSWVKFYPQQPPEIFQKIFEENEKKILILCAISREDMEARFKKDKLELAEDNFSELKNWCAGEDSVQKVLEPEERLSIPFVIRIPEGVDVGEHTGGILIQKIVPESQDMGGGSSIKLTTRVGVRIYETVPGEIIRNLTLTNFKVIKNFQEFSFADWFGEPKEPQEYLVQTTARNDGNVGIEQQEAIHIKNLLFGRPDEDVNRSFQVMKQDSFISNYSWRNPRFGYFAFSTELKYQDSEGKDVVLDSGTVKVWIMPWREMAIALVLLLFFGTIYGIWKLYQKKKYGGAGWAEYKVKKGDTVASLAEKYRINWKVLAKTNKLKEPYLLEAGQVMLVPPTGGTPKIGSDSFLTKGAAEAPAAEKESAEQVMGADTQKEREAATGEKSIAAAFSVPIEKVVKKKTRMATAKPIDIERLMKKKARPQVLESCNVLLPWNKIIWWVAGIVVAVIFGVLVGLLVRQNKQIGILNEKISNISASVTAPPAPAVQEEKAAVPADPVTEQKVDIANLAIKVLNEGGPAGLAGKAKDALVAQGYAKAEADNGEAEDVVGNFVYYSADKFKAEAEKISEFLKTRKIKAEVMAAKTAEQKSAEIVIALGK